MADDDNGTSKEGAGAEGHRPGTPDIGNVPAAASGTVAAATDWTASDTRGPLHEARDVPASLGDDSARAEAVEEPAAQERFAEAPEAAMTTPVARPRSVVPAIIAATFLGAVAGAICGGVVAKVVDHTTDGQTQALAKRFDALDRRPDPQPALSALQQKMAALDQQVAADRKAAARKPTPVAAPFDPSRLQGQMNALEAKVDASKGQSGGDQALGSKVDQLSGALAAQETRSKEAQAKLASATAAVAQIGQQGSAIKAAEAKLGALGGTVATLQKQASGNESQIHDLTQRQKDLATRVDGPALAVAADSLVAQVASGHPYTSQVDALSNLGADPAKIAVLRENAGQGVPSAQALSAKFKPLVGSLDEVRGKPPAHSGFLARLKSGMFGLVSVHRDGDTQGSDAASVSARIQSDLDHDDVEDAVTAWNALPAAAKAKSESWGALAKTSAEAIAAARSLRSESIAALGRKS